MSRNLHRHSPSHPACLQSLQAKKACGHAPKQRSCKCKVRCRGHVGCRSIYIGSNMQQP